MSEDISKCQAEAMKEGFRKNPLARRDIFDENRLRWILDRHDDTRAHG